MRVITADQGTPEWHAARVGVPSGSNFDKLMAKGGGATRAAYLVGIALEIVTGVREQIPVTLAMQHGVETEGEARNVYEMRTGELVEQIGFCLHDTLRCGVSPDGLINDNKLIEIKCPQPKTHLEYMRSITMPTTYKWQVQGQLWVMEREVCDFVSYCPSFPDESKLIIRKTYRDEAAIKELEAEVIRFLADVEKEVEFIKNYREAA